MYQDELKLKRGNKIIKIIALLLIVAMVIGLKILFKGQFSSVENFQKYLTQFGMIAPLILIAFQAFQVIVPVLPGYLGCAAGAVAFGSGVGFLCNYIGISAGSIISYFIAKRFGEPVLKLMFSDKTINKWSTKVQNVKNYDKFLFIATLLPLFPDDFLCYFSGVIKMNAKKFIWIIILGKPWCILAYSLIFGLIK